MDGDSQAKRRRAARCPEFGAWACHGLNTLLLLIIGGLAVAVLVNQGVIIAGQQAAIAEGDGDGEGAALSVLSTGGVGVPALVNDVLAKLMNGVLPKLDAIDAKTTPCGAACNQVAVAGYGPALGGRSLVGLNVLVVGGSRGVGCGAVKAFLDAGANVIATSRDRTKYPMPVDGFATHAQCAVGGVYHADPVRCWPICPNVASTPLDLLQRSSIDNFFDNEPTLVPWSRIDVLVLGGIPTALWNHNNGDSAEDSLIRYKAEVLGRKHVWGRAYSRLKASPDARVINLASIAGLAPGLVTGNYVETKMASVGMVLQWNTAREQLAPLGLVDDNITAISFEAEGVNSSLYYILQNALGAGQERLWFGGGSCYSDTQLTGNMQDAFNLADFLLIANSMPERRAGDAIVWMSSVKEPNSRYAVFDPATRGCIADDPATEREYGTGEEFINRWAFHRDVAKVTKRATYVRAAAAYNNINALAQLSGPDYAALVSSYSTCPIDLKYPMPPGGFPRGFLPTQGLDVPRIRDNFCCANPLEQLPQTFTGADIADLCDDPCKYTTPALAAACAALTSSSASIASVASAPTAPTAKSPFAEGVRVERLRKAALGG